MAILGKIRSLGPVALISVIGLALFAFVFSTGSGTVTDVFKADEFNQSRIAIVNGIEMDRTDFMNSVDNFEKQNRGSSSSIQAMNSVWDTELKKLILKSEYEKLGLSVEREMMRDFLKNNLLAFEDFQNEVGEFDETKLNQFISNLKEISPETLELQGSLVNYNSWNKFEENISSIGLEEIYYKLVSAGINTALFEGEEDYFNSNNVVDFKYVKIPFNSIPDSLIKVKKSDVTSYINQNKSEFSSDETRDLIFVKFDELPSGLDKNESMSLMNNLIEDKVEFDNNSNESITYRGFKNTNNNQEFLNSNSAIKYYDSFIFKSSLPTNIADDVYALDKGQLYGPYSENGFLKTTKLIDSKFIPDSAKVRHILIPYFGSVRASAEEMRSKEDAKKTADSILGIVKRNRNKFESLLSLSSDLVSNQNNGEIDFAYVDRFASEFRDFSFENKVGSVSVVETDFGYHVIEILSQGKKKKAVKVGNLAIKIEPSERTRDSIYNVASKFEIAVNEDNFRSYAKESGFNVSAANNVGKLDETLPIIGKQRTIVRWLYEDDTNKGDIKRFSLQDGGYAIVMLTSIDENGLMSYEKSSSKVLPRVKNQIKAQKIEDKVKGSSLDEIASEFNVEVQTSLSVNMNSPVISGVGNEPSVVGYAMGLSKNVISKAIVGNTGVFYIYVTDKRMSTGLQNYRNNISIINSARSGSARTGSFNALKDNAEIEDFRSLFY